MNCVFSVLRAVGGGKMPFLSLQDAKLITLSEAMGSVCLVGPFRSSEISGALALWFVASVWSAYSLDQLKDGNNKPQEPEVPDPSISLTNSELWAVRRKVLIFLMPSHALCTWRKVFILMTFS